MQKNRLLFSYILIFCMSGFAFHVLTTQMAMKYLLSLFTSYV